MKKEHHERWDVIVIGGGPSGMMAAGHAAERGRSVLLLEKNPHTGKKLDMTGGGRCNILNAEANVRLLLAQYGDAEQFLYSPFSQFCVQSTMDFFSSRGLPLVIEDRKRAFPKTMRATDVTRVMNEYLKAGHVTVQTEVTIVSLESTDGRILAALSNNGTRFEADSFVIATGGYSHPETGSTGDGFSWLRSLGHTTIIASPSLVPLAVGEQWVKALSGITLEKMRIAFFRDGARAFTKTGRLLFTHFGISGPLILNSSARVQKLLHEGAVTAMIDVFPDDDHAKLDARLLMLFNSHPKKTLINTLKLLIPGGVSDALFALLQLPNAEILTNTCSKEDRKRLIHLAKTLPITITGLMGLDRAIISDGGVLLTEVDTRTMRSKKCPNLLLTGDVLDIPRPSGGFSLQLCWTTGWVAGENA